MRFQLNQKIHQLICAISVALAIGVVALVLQVDNIVNVLLYGYGLTFSEEWAAPYWVFLRLALALLGCIAAVNVFSIVYITLFRQVTPTPKTSKPSKPSMKPVLKTPQREIEKEKMPSKEDNGIEIAAIPMVCNKCGKVFTQPLCMFDFASGKPRLVNVCPYCNAILAVAGNSKTK